ncbi:hypothetical protein KC19_VG007800 [Ceratodon purpureus]|uniref:BRCT domain-containing protein n=1 Tax=Ceratodon purpureus TaxID=3225 RepID=A0A8T0HKQ7_CERPU|nr:hypothetical protein KC19_VG007800 [Ceratodon purpureus]
MVGAKSSTTLDENVTHIVSFHNEGQELPRDWMLRSLGGEKEQELVLYGHFCHPHGQYINVVYQDWLAESLAKGFVLCEMNFMAVPRM